MSASVTPSASLAQPALHNGTELSYKPVLPGGSSTLVYCPIPPGYPQGIGSQRVIFPTFFSLRYVSHHTVLWIPIAISTGTFSISLPNMYIISWFIKFISSLWTFCVGRGLNALTAPLLTHSVLLSSPPNKVIWQFVVQEIVDGHIIMMMWILFTAKPKSI